MGWYGREVRERQEEEEQEEEEEEGRRTNGV